jgi:Ca2+-binding RTX toxin-like protein
VSDASLSAPIGRDHKKGSRKMATNSDDIITGSQFSDLISGLNGSDTIQGLGGGDVLEGNAQDDTLIGGTGDDTLDGGTGDDLLEGKDGGDVLIGGANDDRLFGGGEDDFLVGGPGFDHLSGGGETDLLIWENGDGNDVDDGGAGEDSLTITGADEGDIFSLVPNDANTTSVFQRENLVPFNIQVSNIENVSVLTFSGDDFLEVGNLSGTGIATLVFDGEEGVDTLDTRSTTGVDITAFGGGGADFFYGGIEGEEYYGNDGGDHFFTGAGDDIVNAQEGNDQIFTGSGGDSIDAGEGSDTIVSGSGNDFVITGTGSDDLRYDLSPVAGGFEIIEDFQNGVDDLFLGGITQAQVDTNADNLVNDADDLVTYDAINDTLSISFNPTDEIDLVGVESLSVGGDLFFV